MRPALCRRSRVHLTFLPVLAGVYKLPLTPGSHWHSSPPARGHHRVDAALSHSPDSSGRSGRVPRHWMWTPGVPLRVGTTHEAPPTVLEPPLRPGTGGVRQEAPCLKASALGTGMGTTPEIPPGALDPPVRSWHSFWNCFGEVLLRPLPERSARKSGYDQPTPEGDLRTIRS